MANRHEKMFNITKNSKSKYQNHDEISPYTNLFTDCKMVNIFFLINK